MGGSFFGVERAEFLAEEDSEFLLFLYTGVNGMDWIVLGN
jgi:hypothetical protein